ncbi:hypothetical protein C8J56DRAFT_973591 [Mycena floridula]|nr:hypothetical protein C8J56DRAFT_973591 [Mycena floridula]
MTENPPKMTAPQREAARLAYNIPATLKARILPPEAASIQTLCEFKLPPISPSLPTISAAAFFSTRAPAVMSSELLSKLKYLAIPPIKTVNAVMALSREAWRDGYNSIRYVHLSDAAETYFPLWVASLWSEVVTAGKARKAWIGCREWVRKRASRKNYTAAECDAAKECSSLLQILPWGLKKQGLSDDERIDTLWRLLGPHWLTGSIMNEPPEFYLGQYWS